MEEDKRFTITIFDKKEGSTKTFNTNAAAGVISVDKGGYCSFYTSDADLTELSGLLYTMNQFMQDAARETPEAFELAKLVYKFNQTMKGANNDVD